MVDFCPLSAPINHFRRTIRQLGWKAGPILVLPHILFEYLFRKAIKKRLLRIKTLTFFLFLYIYRIIFKCVLLALALLHILK